LLHAILGLILLLFLVFNPDLFGRALGVRTRRRPRRPDVGSKTSDQPVMPKPSAPARAAHVSPTTFVPSFEPFKPERKNYEWVEKKQQDEWEEFGSVTTKDTYPYGYGSGRDANGDLTFRFKEKFRSKVEVEWAKAFDQLGLQWEYEPLKFDMGAEHFSYCPDFRVAGLSIPDSKRPLYIEVKRLVEEMNLTKYALFTELYNCDLLVLAHQKGGVLKPRKARYFIVLRCPRCNTYECFVCDQGTTEDYRPPYAPSVCQACHGTFERMVVPNYFLIEAGTIRTERVVLEAHPTLGLRLYLR
jgi:hypothetical protein